jgi:hypothetical protein
VSDPIESAAKGVTKGVLEWTEEKLERAIQKFRDRKLAFVQDTETIRVAKEQRQTSEWQFFRTYVDDKKLHVLFQMGMTLRQLELEDSMIRLENLRKRIFNKYDIEGLHIAEFVQNGLFSRFFAIIIEKVKPIDKLRSEIKDLFKNIETTVSFIQIHDNVKKESNRIVARIQSHSPATYVISSAGSAETKCKQIKDIVMHRISGYEEEHYSTEMKEIYFLNKVRTLTH